jgi:hypothetical protein
MTRGAIVDTLERCRDNLDDGDLWMFDALNIRIDWTGIRAL